MRAEYDKTDDRMLGFGQRKMEVLSNLIVWRVFCRKRWILYMQQVVNGKIPYIAFVDVEKLTPAETRFSLKAHGWE